MLTMTTPAKNNLEQEVVTRQEFNELLERINGIEKVVIQILDTIELNHMPLIVGMDEKNNLDL